ncbi:regulatory protein RecX [Xylanimonas allomyrinae]|uniref:regulatory protein RecX n=1 Tax=Xylanimonas allomyrinae TaxID=2509459 RepID=UPI001FE2C5BD|nr:regulatory protein RecX [Xylanimonas allomyrinae]
MGKRRGRTGRSGVGARSGERAPRRSVTERLEAGEVTVDEAGDLARETVLRILTATPKSRRELEQAMARKGYPEPVVARVLDRFAEVGLIDDVEYAHMVVRTRHSERGLARRAIAAELRRRGIDDDTAAEALGQVADDDERETAARLAGGLVARTRGLARDARVRRAASALARKGYPTGVAFAAVKDALAAEGVETGDLSELG